MDKSKNQDDMLQVMALDCSWGLMEVTEKLEF